MSNIRHLEAQNLGVLGSDTARFSPDVSNKRTTFIVESPRFLTAKQNFETSGTTPNETASHTRRPESSVTLCREPQISHFKSGWSQNSPVISIPVTASPISPCLLDFHTKVFRAKSVTFPYTFQCSFNLVTTAGEYTKSDAFRCITVLYRVSIFKARLPGSQRTILQSDRWCRRLCSYQTSAKNALYHF